MILALKFDLIDYLSLFKKLMNKANRPYMIAFAGGSASGKTWLLHTIKQYFTSDELCIISQDDYYKPLENQETDENGVVNYDLPSAIDDEALVNDLAKLHNGESITRKEYVFNNPNAVPKLLQYQPAPIIIVEGLFLLYFEKIRKEFDLIVFIETRDDITYSRRLERDFEIREIPKDVIVYQWHNHVYPAYKRFLLPYREEAHIIIPNNYRNNKGLQIMTDHIKTILEKNNN